MNAKTVTKNIGRAIALAQEINKLSEELDLIKGEFRAEAEYEVRKNQTGLVPGRELEGQSWTFTAEDGHACTVSFPSASLTRTILFNKDQAVRFAPNPTAPSKKILVPLGVDVREMCGVAFNKLFQQQFSPVKDFRVLLPVLVTPENRAKKLLAALEEAPGDGRVSFKVKE